MRVAFSALVYLFQGWLAVFAIRPWAKPSAGMASRGWAPAAWLTRSASSSFAFDRLKIFPRYLAHLCPGRQHCPLFRHSLSCPPAAPLNALPGLPCHQATKNQIAKKPRRRLKMDSEEQAQILALLEESQAALILALHDVSPETAVRIPPPAAGPSSAASNISPSRRTTSSRKSPRPRSLPLRSSIPSAKPECSPAAQIRTRRIESPPEGHPERNLPHAALRARPFSGQPQAHHGLRSRQSR